MLRSISFSFFIIAGTRFGPLDTRWLLVLLLLLLLGLLLADVPLTEYQCAGDENAKYNTGANNTSSGDLHIIHGAMTRGRGCLYFVYSATLLSYLKR